MNSEAPQFDIEEGDLDDPLLSSVTVPAANAGEVQLKSAREYLNKEAKVKYDLLKCINKKLWTILEKRIVNRMRSFV